MDDIKELIERLNQRAKPHKPHIYKGEQWTGGMVTDELSSQAAATLSALMAELEKVKRERDSLMMYAKSKRECVVCEHYFFCAKINKDSPCFPCDCESTCPCRSCAQENNWKWCG